MPCEEKKIKPTYLRMILGLADITIIVVVYAYSTVQATKQYLLPGEFSINIPATSAHKSNETTNDDTQQTVINYMSKWQPVVYSCQYRCDRLFKPYNNSRTFSKQQRNQGEANRSHCQCFNCNSTNDSVGTTQNPNAVILQHINTIYQEKTSPTVNDITTSRPVTHDGDKKEIIVLTSKRSGSSFIGRILHEHHDICYLFEPLQIVIYDNNILLNNDKFNSFVQKLFTCAFTDALYEAEVLPGHELYLQVVLHIAAVH